MSPSPLSMIHSSVTQHFRMVLVLSLLWVGLFFQSCNTTDPVIFLNLRNLTITSSLPGQTEGVPNNDYVFKALHSKVTIPIRYEWTFDDGVSLSIRDSNAVHHTFVKYGLYLVTVRVINNESAAEISRATLTVNIRGAIPIIPMVKVPSGIVYMGSNNGVDQSEQPLHPVTISRELLVSTYELRQSEWDAIMPKSPSWFRGDSLPVENITWFEAVDFCNRLSIRSGLVPAYSINADTVQCFFSASGYRLPTEAEWEYVARAGTITEFYSGNPNSLYSGCLSGESSEPVIDSIGWYCHNAEGSTHLCGQKVPNAFGLYDVIGNVGEWVWDWLDGSYYRNGDRMDPSGPSEGYKRVVRGGDFRSGTIDIRVSSRRLSTYPSLKSFSVGMRLVRPQP